MNCVVLVERGQLHVEVVTVDFSHSFIEQNYVVWGCNFRVFWHFEGFWAPQTSHVHVLAVSCTQV